MIEKISASRGESILDRIRYRPGGFSPIEARIATAILGDPRRVSHESIVGFAQRISVSTGSVVRFAKQLGFSGFQELKLVIAEAGAAGAAPEQPQGAYVSRFRSYMDEQMQAMTYAAEKVDPMSIEMAATALAHARTVDIAATGASAVAGQSLLFSLTLLGLHVRFLPDASEQGAAAAFMGAGDCLLAISFSGRTRATVDAASRAAKGGATVIALTCNQHSPLLRHAAIPIVVDARETHISAEWPLRTAMLAVVRALSLYVADEFSVDELGARRSTWASGRFGMRYESS